jgi:Fe-S-cluster containining protein
VKVYSLSIHADYRCRHSGACCSADWDVPVEAPVYRSLTDALTSGRLRPASEVPGGPFVTEPDLPADTGAMLARAGGGDCVFYHRPTGLCVVHRDLGETALPATCRHFPRIAVRDWRGTFITLSHFCPTAASLLFRDDVRVEVVESPRAFPPADYDGLSVHPDAWPPLLHPRMLMDLAGYTAWERRLVCLCAQDGRPPESVVATMVRDALLLRQWKPSNGTLTAAVESLPPYPVDAEPPPALAGSIRSYDEALTAVADELKPPRDVDGVDAAYAVLVLPAWSRFTAPVNRYLAAKSFASWTGYQGRGVLTMVRGVEAALDILRVEAARQCRDAARLLDVDLLREAFRRADFLLNHLAAAEDLAKLWGAAEHAAGARPHTAKTAITGP